MLVYHGSSHNFKTLRIRKDLTRESSKNNEGYGIYFSLDKSVAMSYGRYVYTIQVADNYLIDMQDMRLCLGYVHKICKEFHDMFGVRLEWFLDVRSLAEYLQCGTIPVIGVCREIKLLLDSNERFYVKCGRHVESMFKWLDFYAGAPKAYLFTYQIKDCGIIRDVSPSVATIVQKERIVRG